MIRIGEILDPGNHSGRAQTIALGTIGIDCTYAYSKHIQKKSPQSVNTSSKTTRKRTLNIKRPRQSDPITRPTTSMRKEEIGLSSTRRNIRMSEMVSSPDQPGISGGDVVGVEFRIDER